MEEKKISAEENEWKKQLKELKRKARGGDAEAQFSLGICYEEGYYCASLPDAGKKRFYGKNIPRSRKRAIEWLTKSAEQGLAHAQCALGPNVSTHLLGKKIMRVFTKI